MKRYGDWAPTRFDSRGLALPDQQDWIVHPCGTNRDADALTRSNFHIACRDLEMLDPEGEDHEVHRFGHWACGWLEIIIVRPDTRCAEDAKETESALNNYAVLDDEDFCLEEESEANEAWKNCYSDRERLEYIRDHWRDFEHCQAKWAHDEQGRRDAWMALLANVRGRWFGGIPSELIG